jgi:hypothetical protein
MCRLAYWQLLPKQGCSNLQEQKELIRPVRRLFKGYRLLLLGGAQIQSVKLANWLQSNLIEFVLRQKQSIDSCSGAGGSSSRIVVGLIIFRSSTN